MRSLTYVEAGRLEWRDVPAPRLEGDREALVRPVAASTCDIDEQIIKGNTPMVGPFALGHECLGEVLEVGDDAGGVEPGQLVAIPWHISCGECGPCRRGFPGHCESVPPAAMYGVPLGGEWGGLFDDVVRVPYAPAMLFPVAPGTDPAAVVSASDNATLAVETLGEHLEATPGARVLILGARSTGLYAVDVARALGAGRIVYADGKPERLQTAAELGAEPVSGPPTAELGEFDVIVDARLNGDWLRAALLLLAPLGVCEAVGPYFADTALPLYPMYLRGARFRIDRGNVGAHIPRLLELIGAGRVHPERIVTDVIDWDDAPQALLEHPLKPMFTRGQAARPAAL